jgi:hypothetical protein
MAGKRVAWSPPGGWAVDTRGTRHEKRQGTTETPRETGETPRETGPPDIEPGLAGVSGRDIRASPGYVVAALREILSSETATGQSKASAARTLAEMAGAIGRHQQAPADRAAEARVSLLTRAELERELARLRSICAGDSA